MMKSLCHVVLLSLVAFGANSTTYYKWIDQNGVPHYSQYAPTNGVDLNKVQVINARTFEPAKPPAGANQPMQANMPQANTALTPEQRRIQELEAQNKAQEQQANKERCKSLQNNLQNLNAGGRVYEIDDKGQRQYLDGKAIETRKQTIQQAMQQYCK